MSGPPSISAPEYDPARDYSAGLTAYQAKDYKAAVRAFSKVTSGAPRSTDGWRMLGQSRSYAGDWKGARTAFDRSVRLTPTDINAHAGLALALAKLKDKKAEAELDWLKAKAAACGAGCPDAARLGGFVTQVEAAIAAPDAAAPLAALAPNGPVASLGDATYLTAVGLIHDKRYDDALVALADASAMFGPHPDILTYAGYTWRKKGDYQRASAYYEQALAIAPNHLGATEYYGELKVASGDMAGARRLLAKLDKLCAYGCAQAEELRQWVDHGGDPLQP